MHSRIFAVIPALFALSAAVTFAQAAPKEAHADLVNSQGVKIGSAKFNPSALGLRVTVRVEHLTPGEHGIHIHNVGKCEGPAFTTAGPHFNPTDAHHGVHNAQDPHPHLGDLDNLTADKGGKAHATFVATGVTLGEGSNSLFHDGGTSLIIHAKPDDLKSDPSGNSGDRVACGVIQK